MNIDNPWLTLAWRIVACAGVSAALWIYLGAAVAVPSAVLWGVALARPLMELTTGLAQGLRAVAYRDVEGHYYMHAGQPVEVLETDDARWLRAAALQRLLGDTNREDVFARRFGPGASRDGRRGRVYLRDEAVLAYLAQSSQAMSARRNGLRLFVEREVIDPHRRRRRAGA